MGAPRYNNRIRRAWVLTFALICFWVSSFGTAHHDNDDLAPVERFTVHQAKLAPAATIPPPELCVACSWEQAVANGQIPVLAPKFAPQFVVVAIEQGYDTPHISRSVPYNATRAPPALG